MLATVQQSGNATGVAILGAVYLSLVEAQSHDAALLISLVALVAAVCMAILCLVMLRSSSAASASSR